ncbi:transcriptional regulator [Chamaesiphon sp. GL140_3_metabinner_50]|uniref:helix-turn-helix domain-containing protein n=1 Tax=Chamaesiphon sp. GL140_3_metabinner_50 TaxID=2970812 RepID=UPI0025F7F087|nr:transcriptional regulator [Chamaesiphon sp. GL140_3_metabinner_50]
MTTTIDKKKYLELLDTADIIPKTIETEDEYDRFLAVAQMLMHKRSDRTPEDIALLMLVVKLIEDYELIHHNLDDWEKSTPNELLRHIMTASGTRNVDLIGIIGSSGVVSEVVNGKRTISREQAKSLGKFFKLSPALFIRSRCSPPSPSSAESCRWETRKASG